MSYIGNPIVSTDFPVDYKSGNGSTTAFTLSVAPASVNSIDVQVSGVSQSPQTYSVSGTTLTFSAAPPSGTNNIVVRHLGVAGIPNVPAAGSVVPASIGTGYSLWNLSGSDINYTAGNVGIGTASPTGKLDVVSSSSLVGRFYNNAGRGQVAVDGTSDSSFVIRRNGTQIGWIQSDSSGLEINTGTNGAHPYAFYTNNTERMRIDSSGKWMLGTTSALNSGGAIGSIVFTGGQGLFIATNGQGNGQVMGFNYNLTTNVGSINITGSATSYATSSDYRLKENIAPMVGALDVVQKLKPVTYNWKVDGSSGQGFIAHELQAVVPDCVTGEKDAVDEEGKPIYQGIDTSFLVATLTAAIQELKAELDATKAEIAALKAK